MMTKRIAVYDKIRLMRYRFLSALISAS